MRFIVEDLASRAVPLLLYHSPHATSLEDTYPTGSVFGQSLRNSIRLLIRLQLFSSRTCGNPLTDT